MSEQEPVCSTCNRPIGHTGHERWYEHAGQVRCVPCQEADSPIGRLRAENARLRAALVDLRARMTSGDHPAERGTNWARAPQRWVDLVDDAVGRGQPT